MTHYIVSWTHEVECDDENEAGHLAFVEMLRIGATPNRTTSNRFVVKNSATGDSYEMNITDGTLVIDPLLISQLLGFRHFIWVNQNTTREK